MLSRIGGALHVDSTASVRYIHIISNPGWLYEQYALTFFLLCRMRLSALDRASGPAPPASAGSHAQHSHSLTGTGIPGLRPRQTVTVTT